MSKYLVERNVMPCVLRLSTNDGQGMFARPSNIYFDHTAEDFEKHFGGNRGANQGYLLRRKQAEISHCLSSLVATYFTSNGYSE